MTLDRTWAHYPRRKEPNTGASQAWTSRQRPDREPANLSLTVALADSAFITAGPYTRTQRAAHGHLDATKQSGHGSQLCWYLYGGGAATSKRALLSFYGMQLPSTVGTERRRYMIGELLILTPRAASVSGSTAANIELPSSEADDATINCGHIEISHEKNEIDEVKIHLTDAFRNEIELDGDVDQYAMEAEEDFLAQAILIELPSLTTRPISSRVAFNIVTPAGTRHIAMAR
jgi:hypothetical protein